MLINHLDEVAQQTHVRIQVGGLTRRCTVLNAVTSVGSRRKPAALLTVSSRTLASYFPSLPLAQTLLLILERAPVITLGHHT